MIPLDEAIQTVLAGCKLAGGRSIDVSDALGLVLSEDVEAPGPVPPFANSAMDGYAVRAADVASASADDPVRLKVIGTIAAGHAPTASVGSGEALRIMTGAIFPEGADAVAIVETTRADGEMVVVEAPAKAGEHIRGAGEDIATGELVFRAGTVLGAGHVGVLCSVGREKVQAVPGPVVGVMSTGDELVEGSGPLRAGQIRDSNRRTLLALLSRDGYRGVDLGIARDDEDEIRQRLTAAADGCDAILTSGGVSMGEFDYVKAVLDKIASMEWMQVAIRPAKPFAFGTIGSVPVFGLPGNPVSSMVSYEVLARPGLRRIAGISDGDLRRHPVMGLADDRFLGARDGRTSFVRVQAAFGPDGRLHAKSAGGQGSHQLKAMSLSNALAVVEPGAGVSQGDEVGLLLLSP
ncbi:MAG TPA: gephyrin-like molybdotransferase Glp [Acidimicrobiales bacterium]